MKKAWTCIGIPIEAKKAFDSCKDNSLEKNEKTMMKIINFYKAHQPPIQ